MNPLAQFLSLDLFLGGEMVAFKIEVSLDFPRAVWLAKVESFRDEVVLESPTAQRAVTDALAAVIERDMQVVGTEAARRRWGIVLRELADRYDPPKSCVSRHSEISW